MLTAADMLAAYDTDGPEEPVVASGFLELDSLTGGMVPGRVWIVLGVPGQGRTTLMTQWAAAIAAQPVQAVHLVTPREEPASIASRLLALTGRLPLHRVTTRTLEASTAERLARARAQILELSLALYARRRRLRAGGSSIPRLYEADRAHH